MKGSSAGICTPIRGSLLSKPFCGPASARSCLNFGATVTGARVGRFCLLQQVIAIDWGRLMSGIFDGLLISLMSLQWVVREEIREQVNKRLHIDRRLLASARITWRVGISKFNPKPVSQGGKTKCCSIYFCW